VSKTAKPAGKTTSKTTKPTAGRSSRKAVRRELRQLAREFADQLVVMLERHGVWDDEGHERELGDDAARRIRRSLADLEKVMNRILADLNTRKEPVAIGKVAATLGLTSRQAAHPMSLLVETGKVLRHGERRGARYELAPPPEPPARKTRKKKRSRKAPKATAKQGDSKRGKR